MYFKLNCLVEVESQSGSKIRFTALSFVEIDKSIDRIGSSAKLKIPTSAVLVSEGKKGDTVSTSTQFRRGDKIHIQLGYNPPSVPPAGGDSSLVSEFKGFIYKVNLTTPFEIECEGYEFLLRNDCPAKTFQTTTLKELLNWLVEGTEIKIHGNIPNVSMTNYVVPKSLNKLDALCQLKDKYGLTIYFIENTLYAGLDFVNYLGTVKYSIGRNTVKEGELKYQYADDVKLKVKAVLIKKDNTKVEVEIGDKDGQQRTLFFYNLSGLDELKQVADAEIQKYKFDGYSGKITTFWAPFSAPGMVADIEDKKYEKRGGRYEIRSVKTTMGTSGARRAVEIGKAVS
jgi:hypothetical protein